MKSAIDRYSTGIEKEVDARDFDGQYYIPRREDRFFCPECGERVFLKSGGYRTSHFCHYEKTTRECELRTDGLSGLSLSQRLGLPVYLKRIASGRYQLNIGFPALGAGVLSKATTHGYEVTISCDGRNQQRRIPINNAEFFENSTTLIPISFIPDYPLNYRICISASDEIRRKWSDYAEGFYNDIAIFTSEGKKIRRGGNISINDSYFVVTKRRFTFERIDLKNWIYSEKVGGLDINQKQFSVYKIRITEPNLENIFKNLNKYFYENYGVRLLACQPELIPIWPPVVTCGDILTPVDAKKNVLCFVFSKNENPNVYVYNSDSANKMEIKRLHDDICTVELANIERNSKTLSVDRKYTGREITFISKKLPKSNFEYHLALKNKENDIPWDEFNINMLSTGLTLLSNSRMELYLGKLNKNFKKVRIRNSKTEIQPLENIKDLFFLLNTGGLIKHVNFESTTLNNHDHTENIIKKIHVSRIGEMVPIPRWADFIIKNLKHSNEGKIYNAIIPAIYNGKIYIRTLEELRSLQLKSLILKKF